MSGNQPLPGQVAQGAVRTERQGANQSSEVIRMTKSSIAPGSSWRRGGLMDHDTRSVMSFRTLDSRVPAKVACTPLEHALIKHSRQSGCMVLVADLH